MTRRLAIVAAAPFILLGALSLLAIVGAGLLLDAALTHHGRNPR
jgi:hypothetical protein